MKKPDIESRLRALAWTPLPSDLRREILAGVPSSNLSAARDCRPTGTWMAMGSLALVWILIGFFSATTPDTTPAHPVYMSRQELQEKLFEQQQMMVHLERYGRLPDPERVEFIFELEPKSGNGS
jgi:hypothetical protein